MNASIRTLPYAGSPSNYISMTKTDPVLRVPRNLVGRDIIVGDIHGCFGKLLDALAAVGFRVDNGDRLFSVGDMVDRGPQSMQVLELIGQQWFYAVQGNHEQILREYYEGKIPGAWYAMQGGAWAMKAERHELLPIVNALSALPVAIELETADGMVGIVHAACDYPTWGAFRADLRAGEAGVAENAMWGRARADGRDFGPVDGVRAVVVGHTPMERWTSRDNVLYIDTGAWQSAGACPEQFTLLDASTLRPAERVTLHWPPAPPAY